MKNTLLAVALTLLALSNTFAQSILPPERTWQLEVGKDTTKGVLTYTATGFIATNKANGIRLVNPQSGKNAKLAGHGRPVRLLVNSPDNKYLLSASDEIIRLWDLITLTDKEVKADGLNELMRASLLARDAEDMTSGKTRKILGGIKVITGAAGKALGNERRFAQIKAINIAFEQNCLFGNNAKGRLQILLWNAGTGKVDTLASLPKTDDPNDLMFISPNNQFIAHNYTENAVTRVWLNGIEHTTVPYTNQLFGFSPDGSEFATAVQGGIALWDPNNGVNTRFLAADPGQEATDFTFHRLNRFYAAMRNYSAKLRGYDVGLVFYAGHGVQVRGKNYLIPVDADLKTETDVEFNAYPLDELMGNIEGAAKANIIILDACRNNPFERSWKRSTEGSGSGLGMVGAAPKGTLIAFATSPGATAEDGQGKNGTYTGALLQHLRTKGISTFQLFSREIGTADEQTQGTQIPWMLSSFSDDLILTRNN